MSEYGLTENGFIPKPIFVIRAEVEASLRGTLGNSINTMPESVFGQLIDVYSERESDIWDKLEGIWSSTSPYKASGNALDDVVAINAIKRLKPTYSRVTLQALIGTTGTIVPKGTQFSVDGNLDSSFVTDEDVTLLAGADEIQTIEFDNIPTIGTWVLKLDDQLSSVLNFNATATELKSAIEAIPLVGEVSVSGDFSSGFTVVFSAQDAKQPWSLIQVHSSSLQEGGGGAITITITQSQAGEYQGVVTMTATAEGSEFIAPPRSLTVISTPVSGLDYTTNPSEAVVGRGLETDEELRIRRDQSLAQFGSSTTESIRAEIEEISQDIEFARVYENEEDFTVNTWKPHSIAVYVHQSGGLNTHDQEIGEAIFRKKAGGVSTNGTESITVTDSQGIERVMKFFRATEVQIWLEVDLQTVAGVYPVDGDQQLKEIIAEEGNLLGVGEDVIVNPKLMGWISKVQGIIGVTVRIGKTPSPTSNANITISDGSGGLAEFSSWDISRIIINS